MDHSAQQWAREEFGGAQLGDSRRTERLVRLSASAALRPGGTVTSVVDGSALREGAFRLLENPKVMSKAVAVASHDAATRRCVGSSRVYVAIDGSSLALTDRARKRDVGQVGRWSQKGRGLQVVSSMAVSEIGTPIGVCGQRFWARMQPRTLCKQHYKSMQTEMRHSVEMLAEVHARFAAQAPDVQPWYQLDRGYDAWSVIHLAYEQKMKMTIRACSDRKVREGRNRALGASPRDLAALSARPLPNHFTFVSNVVVIEGFGCVKNCMYRISPSRKT
jgi:hypothetical protein